MNVKTLLLALVIAVTTSAGITIALRGNASGSTLFSSMYNAFQKQKRFEFVEIKNIVITLRDHSEKYGFKERYLLLELALVTDKPENVKLIEETLLSVRGDTVSLLSDMDYGAVRALNMAQLKSKLMASYAPHFKSLNSEMPFEDVIISKMIFQ